MCSKLRLHNHGCMVSAQIDSPRTWLSFELGLQQLSSPLQRICALPLQNASKQPLPLSLALLWKMSDLQLLSDHSWEQCLILQVDKLPLWGSQDHPRGECWSRWRWGRSASQSRTCWSAGKRPRNQNIWWWTIVLLQFCSKINSSVYSLLIIYLCSRNIGKTMNSRCL